MLILLLFVIASMLLCSKGEDEIGTRLPRLQCMTPRNMEGCAGEGYRPVAPYDTYFFLNTRKNPRDPEFLQNCNNSIPANSNFNAEDTTAIIIFGFFEDLCNFAAMREMRDQLLIRGDYNVILVDWSWGHILNFVENEAIVGRQIGNLIENIKRSTGAVGDKFHLIGHSVGGTLLGRAGRLTSIGRMTALDPSGIDVYGRPKEHHILKTDAKMIDVIHTGIGRCFPDYGYIWPLGHADFYVNGGHVQLSCYPKALESALTGDIVRTIVSLITPAFCYHLHATEYFKASINPEDCEFIGYECADYRHAILGNCRKKCNEDMSNCAVMGMNWTDKFADNKTRVYYVETSLLCPYCIKQDNNGPDSST